MEELVTLHDDAHMDFLLKLMRRLEVLFALLCEVLLASSCLLVASLQLVPASDQRSQQFLEVVLEVVRSQQFLEVVLEVVEVPLRFGRVQDVVVVEVLAMDEVAYVHLDHLCGHSGTPAMWQGAATAAGWWCSR